MYCGISRRRGRRPPTTTGAAATDRRLRSTHNRGTDSTTGNVGFTVSFLRPTSRGNPVLVVVDLEKAEGKLGATEGAKDAKSFATSAAVVLVFF